MRLARLAPVFPALLCPLLAGAAALTVNPPLERALTSADGRTILATIVAVDVDKLELVRGEDGARFSLPFERLSDADRDFAAKLFAETKLRQPAPDTAFLQELRKDFLRAAPDRKGLVPLAPDALARASRLVLVVEEHYSGENPPWTQRHLNDLKLDQHTVLWLPCRGDALGLALASTSLPEGHAILSAPALAVATARLDEATRKMMEERSRRSPPRSGEAWHPFDQPEEEKAWMEQTRAKLPRYWPRLPYAPYNSRVPTPPSQAYVLDRDGRAVTFRGEALAGNVRTVFKVLNEQADELK